VELNIDGAFAMDHFDKSGRSWEGDALWTGVKLGLFDFKETPETPGFAIGTQIGPRFATIGAKGVGYGALALVGYSSSRMHVTGNAGAVLDPGPRILRSQSQSLVGGVDFDLDLDKKGTWSAVGSVAAAVYRTHEPTELTVAVGTELEASEHWTLSFLALGGLLPGEDRLGLLFGATPKFYLW
jgi:hypothetical protein